MERINIANSFGVNILGVTIPKNAIYGCIPVKQGRMYYYCTDYEHIDKGSQKYITVRTCYVTGKISPELKGGFVTKTIGKGSKLASLILQYTNENVKHGTRCEYAMHAKECMKHDRKRKKGSGGRCYDYTYVVTDYECSKNPMNDFRRASIPPQSAKSIEPPRYTPNYYY